MTPSSSPRSLWPRPIWLSLALVLSLGINILILGFAMGRHTSLGGLEKPIAEHLDPTAGYFRALRSWPQERRDSFRPLLREHMQGMRIHFREVPLLHQDIHKALTTSPFEPVVLQNALKKLRDHIQISQTKTHTSLIELAKTMTDKERHRLANEMRSHHRMRTKHPDDRRRLH